MPVNIKKFAIGGVVVAAIFAIVILTVLKLAAGNSSKSKAPKNVTVVTDASHATFAYLVPSDTGNWQMNAQRPVFDKTEGVVSYTVHDESDNTDVTISQQPLPSQLTSKNGINTFIANSNVVASQKAGNGTLYFRAEQTIGGSSSGAVTVIYMMKNVLMFGASGQPLSYSTWAKLMASMQIN
jgi:hypothetical protein